MTGRRYLNVLLIVAGLVSLAAMTGGIARGFPTLVPLAALSFAGVAIYGAWHWNRAFTGLPAGRVTEHAAPIAGVRNAQLLALVYCWGGLAMLGCYYLTSLHWQHAWQYGAGMMLIGLAIYMYARALRQPGSVARSPRSMLAMERLTAAQGWGAIAGLTFMVVSGKLWSGKTDWAANAVFLAGGVAVAALSAFGVLTQRKLTARGRTS
ncbi:MAG TPA: hypothetical protein VMX97_14695 [Hyphomicrobiaceae bacterium]|nr:hypothetical protein [Hyphomicrobiaceae bacterium]